MITLFYIFLYVMGIGALLALTFLYTWWLVEMISGGPEGLFELEDHLSALYLSLLWPFYTKTIFKQSWDEFSPFLFGCIISVDSLT